MAVLTVRFGVHMARMIEGALDAGRPIYAYDSLLAQAEEVCDPERRGSLSFAVTPSFTRKIAVRIMQGYSKAGIVGAVGAFFTEGVVDATIGVEVERRVLALKQGFPALPATTCSTILKGLNCDVEQEQVLAIYASYGKSRATKSLAEKVDFTELNRRADRLQQLITAGSSEEIRVVQTRYLAIHAYATAAKGTKERVLASLDIGRSLFFFYWKAFLRYGLLGLIDRARESFRQSKIGLGNEAQLVVNKLRRPDSPNSFFVDRLGSKGIRTDPSTVTKIFGKWGVKNYNCKFVHNLERLEGSDEGSSEEQSLTPAQKPMRWADRNFVIRLCGLRQSAAPIDAPGLFALWYYLEELGIFPILQSMGLTGDEERRGYSWFDLFLLDVARTFYGISSFSKTCEHEELSLPFFCHLLALPCNDSFLNGLGGISEEQVRALRGWLIKLAKALRLLKGRRIGMDFHQIDKDVRIPELRKFGKGPSPKKKLCWTGFRPHIAWDLDTGCLIVAEFRKSSARGTSTVQRFTGDYLTPAFRDAFECVYIDSEYTGKEVWKFILDPKGMDAHLTACLKQNPFVRRFRDAFLNAHAHRDGFWKYYDDAHVYSNDFFTLTVPFDGDMPGDTDDIPATAEVLRLRCVVKKNIKTGAYRCFGTSRLIEDPLEILKDYAERWIIENGIKDLVHSYYLDHCPGSNPRQVDVHFLLVTVCRLLYALIVRDLGPDIHNPDGSVMTLDSIRSVLFRQGAAKFHFAEDTIHITFQDSFSVKRTRILRSWLDGLSARQPNGLQILGGLKLKFHLQVPRGKEHRNSFKKTPIASALSH